MSERFCDFAPRLHYRTTDKPIKYGLSVVWAAIAHAQRIAAYFPREELMPSILNSGQKLNAPVTISTAPTTVATKPSVVASPAPSTPHAANATPATSRMILSIEPTFRLNILFTC